MIRFQATASRLAPMDSYVDNEPRLPLPTRDLTLEILGDPEILGSIWLRIDSGDYAAAPSRLELRPGDEIVLGGGARGGSLDRCARVEDITVSARHCRVIHAGASIEVIDLGSRNGLRVAGVRVPSASLSAGGAFQIG